MVRAHSYQHQFVKTHFPRIGIFIFWSISLQLAWQRASKPQKCSHLWGEVLQRSIFHAVKMFFRLIGGLFVQFLQWNLVFKGLFQAFLNFEFVKTSDLNWSKHVPISKKWPIQQEHVLPIVILPKAIRRLFHKSSFLITKNTPCVGQFLHFLVHVVL